MCSLDKASKEKLTKYHKNITCLKNKEKYISNTNILQ